MTTPLNILILGASYGSLLGTRIAFAGHNVTLVCLPAEANAINANGCIVRMPVRGREVLVELDSRKAPGTLKAAGTAEIDPGDFDLVCLAMQEPQYRADGVRQLMGAVAASGKPVMSIMNMPPKPFLARLPGVDVGLLEPCYASSAVWDAFDPALVTLASPDPQAFRPPEEPVNVLQVSLPTNFKVARFDDRVAYRPAGTAGGGHHRFAHRGGRREGRTAGQAEASRLGLRAAGQVGHAAHRQLPLRGRQ